MKDKKAKKKFEKYKNRASEEDINKIGSKIEGMKKGPLAKIWEEILLLWELIKDPNAAWTAKSIAIGALLYVISPLDAVPDIIPVLGLTDDASVIVMAIAALGTALNKYKKVRTT